MIFKKQNKEESRALEKLVKENFCRKQSIVGCPYYKKSWCQKDCGFYVRMLNEAKYWNR